MCKRTAYTDGEELTRVDSKQKKNNNVSVTRGASASLKHFLLLPKKKKGVPKPELFTGIVGAVGGGGVPATESSASVESGLMQHACRQVLPPSATSARGLTLLVHAVLSY